VNTNTTSPETDPELVASYTNDRIGTSLQLENEHMRVWHLRLAPGQRLPYTVTIALTFGRSSPTARAVPGSMMAG
jgi:hypothetical protein